MRLYEGMVGKTYVIEDVGVDCTLMSRLKALGVWKQSKVTLLNKKMSGTVIIRVRGTRLAMGERITGAITVREAED